MNTGISLIILNSIGGLFFAFAVLRFIATVKAYGGIHRCPFGHMLCLSVRSTRGFFSTISTLAFLITAILYQVSPGAFLPMPFWFGLGLAGTAFNNSILPPSLLVLGCSSPSTLGFAATVSRNLLPLRILHLLQLKSDSDKAICNTLRDGGNRVFTDWRRAVIRAVGFVPAIVIDLRSYTGAVHFELNHLFEMGAYKRTFFIVDDIESILGLLSMVPAALRRDLCVVNANTFVTAIRKIGWGVIKQDGTDLYARIKGSLYQ